MEVEKIKALGEALSKVLLAIAAVVGAFKTPEAISSYASSIKVETIVNNTINSMAKVVNNNSNNMTVQFLQYSQKKLQQSLNNPEEFKRNVELLPADILKGVGLEKSKQEFENRVDGVKTEEELRKVLQEDMPGILLDADGKPFTLDKSRLSN